MPTRVNVYLYQVYVPADYATKPRWPVILFEGAPPPVTR
jgi:hypothetical protein